MFIIYVTEQSEETTEQGTKVDAEYIGDEGMQMYTYIVWSIVYIAKVQVSAVFVSERTIPLIVTSYSVRPLTYRIYTRGLFGSDFNLVVW